MNYEEKIIVGLEIGTQKVCAMVGEVRDDGTPIIIGMGQCPSKGVRKGEIVDLDLAMSCIHSAVSEAEDSAGVEIRSVYASVTGGHIKSFNNRGSVPIMNEEREITEQDIDDVMKNARTINIPMENWAIHNVRQHFYVDGQDGVINPLGMNGYKLDVDVHVIHGVRTRVQNTVKCIKSVPLQVEDIVFSAVASAFAVLTPQQRELGALVIDIGAGTTEYILFTGGTIRHTGVLAVGGDHITNDLALGLKIPLNRAEKFKQEHGHAIVKEEYRGQQIQTNDELGMSTRSVDKYVASQIIEARVSEILQLIFEDLDRDNLLEYIGAGIFLTGGGAHLKGMRESTERIFNQSTQIGTAQMLNGLKSVLDLPEYATSIGLITYGLTSMQLSPQPSSAVARFGMTLKNFVTKVRIFSF